MPLCTLQDQVSSSATSTVLKGLQPDTLYTVTLVPVYAEGDGRRMSEDGKTSTALREDSQRVLEGLSALCEDLVPVDLDLMDCLCLTWMPLTCL